MITAQAAPIKVAFRLHLDCGRVRRSFRKCLRRLGQLQPDLELAGKTRVKVAAE